MAKEMNFKETDEDLKKVNDAKKVKEPGIFQKIGSGIKKGWTVAKPFVGPVLGGALAFTGAYLGTNFAIDHLDIVPVDTVVDDVPAADIVVDDMPIG